MKKSSSKNAARVKASRRPKGGRLDDSGFNELEAQADRLKSDWMSLAVQLGIGGDGKHAF